MLDTTSESEGKMPDRPDHWQVTNAIGTRVESRHDFFPTRVLVPPLELPLAY